MLLEVGGKCWKNIILYIYKILMRLLVLEIKKSEG